MRGGGGGSHCSSAVSFRARNSSIGSGATLQSSVGSVRLQEPAGTSIILFTTSSDESPNCPDRRAGDHTPSTATEPAETFESETPRAPVETSEAETSDPAPSLRRQSTRATAGTPSSEPCSPCPTSSATFSEHVSFRGGFTAEEASSAGFFSHLNPPRAGEDVVCYQRDKWLRRGIVKRVKVRIGDGTGGLQQGAQGAWVTVKDKGAWFSTFQCYAVFLAPANHARRNYSSVCSESEFRSSNFCTLYAAHRCADILMNSRATPETGEVSMQDARESLQRWLDNLVDAQGHKQRVPPELKAELLRVWDDAAKDPAIHLYTRQQRLLPGNKVGTRGPKWADYSLYYTALNNMLNHDTLDALQKAMPLVRRMMFSLLFHERCQDDSEDEGEPDRRLHAGGTFYKGDVDKPTAQDMWKLKEAQAQGSLVRFRQFQSTTSSKVRATKFRHRRDTTGYEWVVEVGPDFWGARDIQDLSKVGYEAETLFPPYSAFRVLNVYDDSCHLEAVDRSQDKEWHALLADLETMDFPAHVGSRSASLISSPRRAVSSRPCRRSTASSVSSISVTDETLRQLHATSSVGSLQFHFKPEGSACAQNSLQVPTLRAITPPGGTNTSRPSPNPSKSPVPSVSHATTAPGEFHRAVVDQLRAMRVVGGRRRGGRGGSSRRSTSNTPGDDGSPVRAHSDRPSNATSEYHPDGGDAHGVANAAFLRKRSKTETEPSLSGVSVKFDLPSGFDSDSPSEYSRQTSARARGSELSPTTRSRSRGRRTSSDCSDVGADCSDVGGSSPLGTSSRAHFFTAPAEGESDLEAQRALQDLHAGGVPAASAVCPLDKSPSILPRHSGLGVMACCCGGPQPGPPPELAE